MKQTFKTFKRNDIRRRKGRVKVTLIRNHLNRSLEETYWERKQGNYGPLYNL